MRKSNEVTETAPPAPVKIRLLVGTHEHQGKVRAVGEEIKVRPDQAEWLVKEKIAELAKGAVTNG